MDLSAVAQAGHSNYPDDPVRGRVPKPQAANSENRLARTPIFGGDSIR